MCMYTTDTQTSPEGAGREKSSNVSPRDLSRSIIWRGWGWGISGRSAQKPIRATGYELELMYCSFHTVDLTSLSREKEPISSTALLLPYELFLIRIWYASTNHVHPNLEPNVLNASKFFNGSKSCWCHTNQRVTGRDRRGGNDLDWWRNEGREALPSGTSRNKTRLMPALGHSLAINRVTPHWHLEAQIELHSLFYVFSFMQSQGFRVPSNYRRTSATEPF